MAAFNDAIVSWSNICKTSTCLLDFSITTANDKAQHYIPRGAGQSFGDAAFLTNGHTLCSAPLREMGAIDLKVVFQTWI